MSILSFSDHRATVEDLIAAFDGTVRAYKCVACSGFFLKQLTGMMERTRARLIRPSSGLLLGRSLDVGVARG